MCFPVIDSISLSEPSKYFAKFFDPILNSLNGDGLFATVILHDKLYVFLFWTTLKEIFDVSPNKFIEYLAPDTSIASSSSRFVAFILEFVDFILMLNWKIKFQWKSKFHYYLKFIELTRDF